MTVITNFVLIQAYLPQWENIHEFVFACRRVYAFTDKFIEQYNRTPHYSVVMLVDTLLDDVLVRQLLPPGQPRFYVRQTLVPAARAQAYAGRIRQLYREQEDHWLEYPPSDDDDQSES